MVGAGSGDAPMTRPTCCRRRFALPLALAGRRETRVEFRRVLAEVEAEMARPLWKLDLERLTERDRRMQDTLYQARYAPVASSTLGRPRLQPTNAPSTN